MDLSNGEIIISPKIIYWIEMPPAIGEEEHIELLKNDVLLVNYSAGLNELKNLSEKKTDYTVFFFNLDKMIHKNKKKSEDDGALVSNIIQFIKTFGPDKSIIHTSMINEKLAHVIKAQGIAYLEKNLEDKKVAIATIMNLIKPFFTIGGRLERTSFRLNLFPMKYKVNILNLSNYALPVKAVLRDLSLNGLGMVISDQKLLDLFKLKDMIKIEVLLRPTFFNINSAIITRIDRKAQEVGVSFDISNSKMVNPIDADTITKVILKWINQILDEYGKIE